MKKYLKYLKPLGIFIGTVVLTLSVLYGIPTLLRGVLASEPTLVYLMLPLLLGLALGILLWGVSGTSREINKLWKDG